MKALKRRDTGADPAGYHASGDDGYTILEQLKKYAICKGCAGNYGYCKRSGI